MTTPPGGGPWTAYCANCPSMVTLGSAALHGHHIVMKGDRFDANTAARKILYKFRINPYCGCANLVIARNWCHSKACADRVLELLGSAYNEQTASAALAAAAREFADCKFGTSDQADEVDPITDQ